jgi:hypothetical protein
MAAAVQVDLSELETHIIAIVAKLFLLLPMFKMG